MFIAGHLPSKLHVLLHDCDVLGMKGTQVSVLKQSDEVCFWSLLEGKYSCALEMNVILEILSNLSYQTIGMAPFESKGQLTFGISRSLKAAMERNVKLFF